MLVNFLTLKKIGRSYGHGFQVPTTKIVDFLLTVGRLKNTKRTGWINHHVQLPESVSDHMYRLGMMAFCVQDSSLDRNRLAKIGLVHDLAEAVVGDIVPTEYSGVSKADKHKREVEALESIVDLLDASPQLKEDVRSLWYEYETASSEEGQVVRQLDKLEMVIQAFEYEEAQRCRLDDFFNSTAKAFTHPELVAIQTEILRRRTELQNRYAREHRELGLPLPQPVTKFNFVSGEATITKSSGLGLFAPGRNNSNLFANISTTDVDAAIAEADEELVTLGVSSQRKSRSSSSSTRSPSPARVRSRKNTSSSDDASDSAVSSRRQSSRESNTSRGRTRATSTRRNAAKSKDESSQSSRSSSRSRSKALWRDVKLH